MLLWIIIKVALDSLWRAKLRSVLAILGIVMGVGAVISMLSIVEGARRQVQGLIAGMGTNVLFVWPESGTALGKGSVARLTLADAQAVLARADDVVQLSPMFYSEASLRNGNKSVSLEVVGATPTYTNIRNRSIESGRMFTNFEVEQAARVAVLGSKTAEKLFGMKEPIDGLIKINLLAYRVIGVLKAIGAEGYSDGDNLAIMPFTTAQRELEGRHADLNSLCIQASSTERMKAAENEIRFVLRKNHRLRASAKDDFGISNQASLLEARSKTMRVLAIVLSGIGGICLLTGGIGIMNIMLVIVTERTREIGLRKALGARGRDILGQFLLEAVVISVVGGLLGVAGGIGLSVLIKSVTPLKTVVSGESMVIALGFATGIGIFFGFYPALQAARLDPIEALARE